ncbi:membrane protein UL14 [Aotine betaherpesvirus 1]|uniref:Membrane protein UL14 n=1 Tax=Aotine betaherpesvirus 1 TaxID=50290 RepID=G8XU86_9BETA|nr:membrane protein UL14 [Aotine betaherpesvirus 1]AEV80717.1 membrane protein UL14 [Aotine betaherpesvirus 1]
MPSQIRGSRLAQVGAVARLMPLLLASLSPCCTAQAEGISGNEESVGPLLAGHGEKISIPCFSHTTGQYMTGLYVVFCARHIQNAVLLFRNGTKFLDTLSKHHARHGTIVYHNSTAGTSFLQFSFTFEEKMAGRYNCLISNLTHTVVTTRFTLLDRVLSHRYRKYDVPNMVLPTHANTTQVWSAYPNKLHHLTCVTSKHTIYDVFYIYTAMSTVSCQHLSKACRHLSLAPQLTSQTTPGLKVHPARTKDKNYVPVVISTTSLESHRDRELVQILNIAELALWVALLTFIVGLIMLLRSLRTALFPMPLPVTSPILPSGTLIPVKSPPPYKVLSELA